MTMNYKQFKHNEKAGNCEKKQFSFNPAEINYFSLEN